MDMDTEEDTDGGAGEVTSVTKGSTRKKILTS